MEIYVMDTDFNMTNVLDVFKSFIWTDRYYGNGDFELFTKVGTDILNKLKIDYYLWNKDSGHVMIVENIEIDTDIDDGDTVKITGRSLESILDRRIVWPSATISGNLQACIKTLINDSIISPTISDRKIENFIFKEITDTAITSLTVEETEFNGDSIYDVVLSLCSTNGVGFQIIINGSNQFEFSLYIGADRSYDQTNNSYVTFSPEFDNLINSSYIESKQSYKNVTLVAGEKDENSNVKTASSGSASGLDRRELYTVASDISQKQEDDTTLSDEDYEKLLVQKGTENLQEYAISKVFDGEFDATQLYTYNEDFFMGDIVQISNEYGITKKARIIEFIQSQDADRCSMYPSFSIID